MTKKFFRKGLVNIDYGHQIGARMFGVKVWRIHPSWGNILLIEIYLFKHKFDIYLGKWKTERRPVA